MTTATISALRMIANLKTLEEMDDEELAEADFEAGFTEVVQFARAVLLELPTGTYFEDWPKAEASDA